MEQRDIIWQDGQEGTSALLKRLENAGCQMDEALDRVFGDEEFLEEMVLEFFDDPSIRELEKAMKDKSAEGAFAAAHTLRGAALTLGVCPVGKPAARLTELLRGSGEIPDAAWAAFDELERGLTAVREAAGV